MCLCICVQIQHYTRNVLCDLIFVWLCEGKKNHCVWFHFIFIVRADAVFLGAVWAVSCFCFSSLLSIWLLLSSLLPTENWCSRCSSSRRRGSLIAWKLDFAAEWQKLLMIGEADREKQSDLTASYGEKEQKWKTNLRFSSHTNPRLGLKPLWMSRVRLLHLFTWAYVRLSTCLYPQCFSVLLHTPLFGWVRDSGAPLKRKQRLIKLHVSLVAGFRDWVPKELQRVGCVELLNTVQKRVRPKLHAFGGIHEGTENKMCLYEAARGDISTETLAEFLVWAKRNLQIFLYLV